MQYESFQFRRDAFHAAPMRITLEENALPGAESDLRYSVWVAAITAGLQRGDDMAGVEITMRFDGTTGGGSAGTAFCLAFLTALDGRTLPDDFALTGQIFPDGMIGPIGGFETKAAAAARAGKRTLYFSPLQETDTGRSWKTVDGKFPIRLQPVANVRELYERIHGLYHPSAAPAQAAPGVPARFSDYWRRRYIREQVQVTACLADTRRSLQQHSLRAGDRSAAHILPLIDHAERAFAAGAEAYAANQAGHCNAFVHAWRDALAYKATLTLADHFAEADVFNGRSDRFIRQAMQGKKGMDETDFEALGLAVQFASDFDLWPARAEFLADMKQRSEFLLHAPEKRPAATRPASAPAQLPLDELLFERLVEAEALAFNREDYASSLQSLARLTPAGPPLNHHTALVERYFRVASHTATSERVTFQEIDSGPVPDRQGRDGQLEPLIALSLLRFDRMDGLSLYREGRALRKLLGVPDQDPLAAAPDSAPALLALSAQSHASFLARNEGLSAWELVGDYDDAKAGRTFRPCVDAARAQAIDAINDCNRRGIACIDPAQSVKTGDFQRDDDDMRNSARLVAALISYDRAFFQARALLMTFRSDEN